MLDRRAHGDHLGVGLGVHEAREAVAVVAAHAAAERHVALVEQDPARGVERMQPRRGEVVGELLDARLVRDRRERIRRARRRLGRVLAARAVHLVELLGLRVVRLDVLVGDRPRGETARRGAASRRSPARAGGTAPRRTASSRRRRSSAPGRERRQIGVVPGVRRDVAAVHEHVLGQPVLRLAPQPVPALEQQDPLARRRQTVHQRAAAGAAADHDHVIVAHALISCSRSARMIRPAASTSARCENACGKLPRCRPVSTSNSSA